ncbi:rRNA pseudouridine synthase [Cuneatibacter sp. NSJ-177]|uniref:pseudouridine synthase n=1 Tax=Cuneatibacter sp. NSJ-177 TaxID=2931401 RepID=UPI001FD0FE0A|nr:pseudouridine synthase [Cuneatibacter sp. NSJ-177]MCJ7834448.1 rRNA pseudouridine synthase [Cuneatibacter sp. NSJ-177]
MGQIRLDKLLADAGYGTRSQVRQLVRKKQVTVNGEPAKGAEQKIDVDEDQVQCMGRPVFYAEYEYYMLNKPAGVVSAVTDSRDKTVVELIEERQRRDLFPVGRLDKDTEGLLLITNDGILANRLLAPGRHVDKTYYAEVDGPVTQMDVRLFAEGLDIGEEKRTLPARLVIEESGRELSKVWLTITEGKFHQVKRMFQAVGRRVLFLKRLSMGTLTLDPELKPGEYRKLTDPELLELKRQGR